MRDPIDVLASYLQLALAAARRKQPLVRDRVLLLAAVIAAQINLAPIAAACRQRILRNNPRHLVRRWPTIAAALAEEEFQTLVNQLSTRYGPERVEQLVDQLNIGTPPRSDYSSDGEFAAALLGLDGDDLQDQYGAEEDDSESDD